MHATGRLGVVATLMVVCAISSSCGVTESVWIVGDASCEDAKVRLNGTRVGRLGTRSIVDKPLVNDEFRGWWGDEATGDTIWRVGDVRFEATLNIVPGRYLLEIECGDGSTLRDSIHVQVYNVVKVSCERHRLLVATEGD